MSERESLFSFLRRTGARAAEWSGLLTRRTLRRAAGSNPAPSVSFRLRRGALRVLGVPFWEQREVLDTRRKTIIVSAHAMKQIGPRYHIGNPMLVIAEVAAAIATGRVGEEAPTEFRHRAKKGSKCAWTEDVERIYIIRRLHGGRGWCVVTALPRIRDEKWWQGEVAA